MKVGLARYPYITPSLRGGDSTLFDRIQQLYEEHGHDVKNITYRRPGHFLINGLPPPIRRALLWLIDLMLPAFFSFQIKKLHSAYDIILADSSIITNVGDMNVISIVNIDYQAYEDALKQHLPLRSRIKLKFSKFFQNSGAKHYPSIAVSNFVTSTYKKKGINVLTTISNSIQESNRINHAPTWNGRFIYAGSGSFFGKGIDILIQLAKRGLEIDCYTDAVYDGLKSFPPLPRKILLDRYRDYCMLIFPSRYESFGFVPLEAMSAGLPVLLRRTGIGCDLENEIPEFILSSTDEKIADEIMEKIALIKNDYENFSRRAQEFSKNFCEHANFDSAWLRLLQYHAKGQK